MFNKKKLLKVLKYLIAIITYVIIIYLYYSYYNFLLNYTLNLIEPSVKKLKILKQKKYITKNLHFFFNNYFFIYTKKHSFYYLYLQKIQTSSYIVFLYLYINLKIKQFIFLFVWVIKSNLIIYSQLKIITHLIILLKYMQYVFKISFFITFHFIYLFIFFSTIYFFKSFFKIGILYKFYIYKKKIRKIKKKNPKRFLRVLKRFKQKQTREKIRNKKHFDQYRHWSKYLK